MKKIMILGAGIYQVPLIETAKKMGLYTIVVSIPGNYPGFAIADKVYYENTVDDEKILEIAQKEQIDGIITTGTDVCVITIGKVCDAMGLSGLSYEAAQVAVDKMLMKTKYEEYGVRTARFRLMALSLCLSNTAVGCITQCLSPHLSDNGYTVQTAALLVSVGMGLLAVGKIILGELYDRMGTRRGTLLAMSCGLLGVVGMIFCRSRLGLAGIFLGQGIGCAFGTVGVPIVVQNLFGKKDYASNFGFISACTSVGGAISPTLNGAVFDHFGSYNPAFALWAVLLIGALAVYWVLLPREETHR